MQEQLQLLVQLQSRMFGQNEPDTIENLRRVCYQSGCFFQFLNEVNLAKFFTQCSNILQTNRLDLSTEAESLWHGVEWVELIYQVFLAIRSNNLQIELAPFQQKVMELQSLGMASERNFDNENPRS